MKKNNFVFKLLFVAAAMACLIGAVSVVRLFVYKEPVQYVTVSFETDGGTEVLPVRVVMGETLTAEPYAVKEGLIFVGWCTDAERTQPFYRSEPLNENITLYANYVYPKSNCSFYSSDSVYVPSVEKSFSFSLGSDARITSLNLSDYVQAEAIFGTLPTLRVSSSGNGYVVSPESSYGDGAVIRFTLKRDGVTFLDYGNDINMLTVTVSTEDISRGELDLGSGIKFLSRESITFKNSDLSFVIPTAVADKCKIAEGSTVCLGDGVSAGAPNTSFIKIDSLSRQSSVCIIEASECSLNDVISALNTAFSFTVSKPEYLTVNVPDISSNILNGNGVKELTNALAAAIVTENNYLNANTSNTISDSAEIFNEFGYTVEGLADGLTVHATLAEAKNPSFSGVDENDWVAVKVTLSYDSKLQNGDDIKADIVITYYIKAVVKGTFNCDSDKNSLNYTADIYSETDMRIDASKNGVNITNQIKGILSGDSDISRDEALEELLQTLKSKTEPIELFEIPLLKGTFEPMEGLALFSGRFEFNYAFSVNLGSFSANSDITVLDAVEIGLSADTQTGELSAYRNRITPYSNKFYTDSYASGYMGVRSGLNGKLSMTSDAFKRLGTVGAEFKTGIYADIYGYSHINAYRDSTESGHADGAAYVEIGNYISVSTFAESEYFKDHSSGSASTGHNSVSTIFKGGNKRILISVNSNVKNTYLSDGNVLLQSKEGVYSDFDSVPLLSGNYVDVTTGETLSGNFIPSELLEVRFSSRYFTYDKSMGYVKINSQLFGTYDDGIVPGTNTLSCEMDVYYTGSNIFPSASSPLTDGTGAGDSETESDKGLFSTSGDKGPRYSSVEDFENDPYYRREISSLIWIRPGFNYGSLGLGNTVTATFAVDTGDGIKTLGERQVVVGEKVGAFDMSSILEYYTATDGWDKDPAETAIIHDTTFTFKAKKKQTVVAFVYFDGTKWVGKVQAVDLGTIPTVPADSGESYEEMNFTGWEGTRGTNALTPSLRLYNDIKKVSSDIFSGSLNSAKRGIVYGYEPNATVETASGTKEEVLAAIYESAVNMGAGCYIAQYASDTFPVTFIYTDDNGKRTEYTYNVRQGFDATQYAKIIENSYSNFIGWDADGDGEVDYRIEETLPTVMGAQTYTAIYSTREATVFTYEYTGSGSYGKKSSLTVTSGAWLKDIVSGITPSAPSAGVGESYEFLYWELSWDDELWFEASDFSNLRVDRKIYLRPVFKRYITLTFDAGEGTFGKFKTAEKTVAADHDVYFSTLYLGTPVKEKTEQSEYTFIGWKDTSDGDRFYAPDALYTATHTATFVAVYERADRKYSVTVKTEHGTVGQGEGRELSFNVTFGEAESIKNMYVSNLPRACEENGFYYRCTGSSVAEDDASNSITITYSWEKLIRLVFDANGGTFKSQSLDLCTKALETSFSSDGKKIELIYSTEGGTFALEPMLPPTADTVFLGFENGKGELFKSTDTVNFDKNCTLTAVWQKKGETVYSVTLDAGENTTFINGSRYFTLSGRPGESFPRLPADPSDDAIYDNVNVKNFAGWDSTIPTTFTSDMQISAVWETVKVKYEVAYYIGDELIAVYYLREGEALPPDPEISVPEGTVFSGWKWFIVDESYGDGDSDSDNDGNNDNSSENEIASGAEVDISGDTAGDTADNTVDNIGENVGEDVSEDVGGDVSGDVNDDIGTELPEKPTVMGTTDLVARGYFEEMPSEEPSEGEAPEGETPEGEIPEQRESQA